MSFSLLIRDPDKKAKSLVRKITHLGETDLDKDFLKELKEICKSSDDNIIRDVYKECMKCLKKEHSQVRVSTVKLLDYLFQKSHIIRNKLLDNFDVFLELTLAISKRPKVKLRLPPPKKYISLLQEITIKYIHSWHSDYGPGYERMRYVYKYLKEHKLVDFSQFQVRTREDQIKQQQLLKKQAKILSRSIENKLLEYRELRPQFESIIAKIESLIDMLIPKEESFSTLEDRSEDEDGDDQSARQNHGIANTSQSIEIEFSPFVEVMKREDNKEVVQNLRELKKQLVEEKMPRLAAIEKTLCKQSDQFLGNIKDIIDLKTKAMNLIMKLSELKIISDNENKSSNRYSFDDSSDEDEFEEVAPKEDLELYIPKNMRREYGLEAIDPRELNDSNKVTLTEEIFDSSSGASTSNCRPVATCGVRLDSGKLCPRQDKIKCPFHGKIIPRDSNGVPIDEDYRLEEERKERNRKSEVPEWQDPELLKDIKLATGIDLTMPVRGKTKLKPERKLANVKTCDVTPKQRLQKKLRMLSK